MKAAFVGFGEVNTPKKLIVKKCTDAAESLKKQGLELVEVFPVTDDYEEKDVRQAIENLQHKEFDTLILCVAGWIPTHAVVKITEEFRHVPMVLWGLCGWYEENRLVTTADQAGTTALRKVLSDLGYSFIYVYDIIGKPTRAIRVATYCKAVTAAKKLRQSKAGMMGYRDMNLYGTLFDGLSLKKTVGPEIETFDMLEMVQRYENILEQSIQEVLNQEISKWTFLKRADEDVLRKGVGYFLALKQIIQERKFKAFSLKDVDGMKKLLGFPPAMIFMLLADTLGICTIPENDSLGSVTQMMVKFTTGQIGAYLEFYEFMEDRVLAGVPDYIPKEITAGETMVMPAAFGELSQGLTMCRLTKTNDRYVMHLVKGEGVTPRKWEEVGWTQPAPQLPGLEILMEDVERFADNVMSQHYIISYGDHTQVLIDLCVLLGIEILQ